MPGYFILNGKLIEEGTPVLSPDNRAFRYGDGLFETLRARNGILPLWDRHMDRLFNGLERLQFPIAKLLNRERLQVEVTRLLQKNKWANARVRISFYRGEGGLSDHHPLTVGYLIQAWPISADALAFNTNGLQLGVYPEVAKSPDFLAALKSNNYLPYVMASIYAQQQKWNDALVLNTYGRIADSTIANIFWTQNGQLYTTPLSEAPVAGVMRKLLLEKQDVVEQAITQEDLYRADEVFLTNAVRGIQWVASVDNTIFLPGKTAGSLYAEFIRPLFG